MNYVWTNAAPIIGQLLVDTNNGLAGDTTNLFNQLSNDWSSSLRFSYAASNSITVKTYVNGLLTISNSVGWMTNGIVTNIVSAGNATSLTESNFNATGSLTLGASNITSWAQIGGGSGGGIATNNGIGTNTTINHLSVFYNENLNGGSITNLVSMLFSNANGNIIATSDSQDSISGGINVASGILFGTNNSIANLGNNICSWIIGGRDNSMPYGFNIDSMIVGGLSNILGGGDDCFIASGVQNTTGNNNDVFLTGRNATDTFADGAVMNYSGAPLAGDC